MGYFKETEFILAQLRGAVGKRCKVDNTDGIFKRVGFGEVEIEGVNVKSDRVKVEYELGGLWSFEADVLRQGAESIVLKIPKVLESIERRKVIRISADANVEVEVWGKMLWKTTLKATMKDVGEGGASISFPEKVNIIENDKVKVRVQSLGIEFEGVVRHSDGLTIGIASGDESLSKIFLPKGKLEDLKLFLKRKYGISILSSKDYFVESKIRNRSSKLGLDFDKYLERILRDEAEFDNFIDDIAITETSFFRDPAQLDIFKRRILRSGQKIMSAGCSTGEEVYTIAMLMLEDGKPGSILGIDISSKVIEIAKRGGPYSPYSLRKVPTSFLKYFKEDGDGFWVKDEVKKLTRFIKGNILSLGAWIRTFDVIFCKNVLIYFDSASREISFRNFASALKPEGFLILGSAESEIKISKPFEPVVEGNVIIYKLTS